jgi:hypothetical protein
MTESGKKQVVYLNSEQFIAAVIICEGIFRTVIVDTDRLQRHEMTPEESVKISQVNKTFVVEGELGLFF